MPHCFYDWLSAKPPILRYTAAREYDVGNALPPMRIYRLPIYFWHRTADDIEHYHLQAKAHRPQDVLHHLINERELFLEVQARGIPATFTNQNALLDERVFTVQPDARHNRICPQSDGPATLSSRLCVRASTRPTDLLAWRGVWPIPSPKGCDLSPSGSPMMRPAAPDGKP